MTHLNHGAHVPPRYVRVELGLVSEQQGHTLHLRHVPERHLVATSRTASRRARIVPVWVRSTARLAGGVDGEAFVHRDLQLVRVEGTSCDTTSLSKNPIRARRLAHQSEPFVARRDARFTVIESAGACTDGTVRGRIGSAAVVLLARQHARIPPLLNFLIDGAMMNLDA